MISETPDPREGDESTSGWVIFIKGIFMGTADVIPGVSGGTMALILGIYERLIDAIRSINLEWFRGLFQLVSPGDGNRNTSFLRRTRELHLDFLVPLGAGIVAAILAGSQILPPLMADYPSIVRGFFFGLILSSLWIPLRWVSFETFQRMLPAVALLIVGAVLGFYLTDPGRTWLPEKTWVDVPSADQQLGTVLRRGGSALPAEQVFWSDENRALRNWVQAEKPLIYAELPRPLSAVVTDRDRLKARSAPFQSIRLPADLSVSVPRLSPYFTFFIGFIAICAMILPGISGSYILLILGGYFFVLNLIKGGLHELFDLSIPWLHTSYIAVFAFGAICGLAAFSRILYWLLEFAPSATMALLTGIMAGCLRGIWPFRSWNGGWENYLPAMEMGVWTPVLLSFCAGVLGMVGLYWLESRTGRSTPHDA